MVFSSLTFLCIFLPITLLIYYLLPSIKLKNGLLIVSSLVFYAYGEPVYIILMIGSTIANYFLGRWISGRKKRYCIILAVILNLIFLGIFKYADMVVLTVNQVFHGAVPVPGIKLPIGISFFTFQIMSYIIDVYRGDADVQRNYGDYYYIFPFFLN